MGPQQGSKEDWPSVDGGQKMGGAVPNQAQGGQQAAQPTAAEKAAAPNHVKKAASRDYSELIDNFD